MATINQMADGLRILAQSCDGDKCMVVGDITCGPSDPNDVTAIEETCLRSLGWTIGDFGWEIRCE